MESNFAKNNELATLQDDLKKLCQCVEEFGPPAPTLNPTVNCAVEATDIGMSL